MEIANHVNRFLRYLTLFLVAAILTMMIHYSIGFNSPLSTVVNFVAYFGATWWIRYRLQRHFAFDWKVALGVVLLPGFLFALELLLRHWVIGNVPLYVVPRFFSGFIGVLFALLTFRMNRIKRTVSTGVVGLLLIGVYVGYDYVYYQLGYFGVGIDPVALKSDVLYTAEGDVFNFDKKNTIYVADFWFSRCAGCFSSFPDVNEKYHQSKEVEGLEVLTINHLLEGESREENLNRIRELGYDFPVLFFEGNGEELGELFLSYTGFPFARIIKNEEIIFEGRFHGAWIYATATLN